MRLALAQMNTVVGDLDGNRAAILARLEEARAGGAELALFPELAVTGYPPEDLLLRPGFIRAAAESLRADRRRDEGRRRRRRLPPFRQGSLQRMRRLRGRRGEGRVPQAVPAELRRVRRGSLLRARTRARAARARRHARRLDHLRGHVATGAAGDRSRSRRRGATRERGALRRSTSGARSSEKRCS